MRYTIFDTPIISPLIRILSSLFMKMFGWRVEGRLPNVDKVVVIAAPHTSNWDLPILLSVAFALRVEARWLGKNSLFQGPLGFLSKWMGGIPVDRSASQNLVAQTVEMFRNSERLILAIPPEGTRGKVSHWKTGFYYIALGAGVPISFGFMDYARKVSGLGPAFYPTGNIEEDMKIIRNFYSNVTAKYPEKASLPTLIQDQSRES